MTGMSSSRSRSPKSAEQLLENTLGIQQSGNTLSDGSQQTFSSNLPQSWPISIPYSSSSTTSIAALQNTAAQQPGAFGSPSGQEQQASTVPYISYFQEIQCFSQEPSQPVAHDLIRDYMQALLRPKSIQLHTGTLHVSKSDIPSGRWTMAFAPSILNTGAWIIAFAAPQDSEFVWFFWPDKYENDSMEGKDIMDLELFLSQLVQNGKLSKEKGMRIGGERHRKFHAMVQQAVWADANVLETDWRVGEFRHVV